MKSKATARYVRVSAQKARLVADLVRGMDVHDAIEILTFTPKKSAPMVRRLIESAVANAEHEAGREDADLDIDELFISEICVDAGPSLRRFRPRAQGRATRILKKTSHITVQLAVRQEP
jgi:large subunit ribosomal protein L22